MTPAKGNAQAGTTSNGFGRFYGVRRRRRSIGGLEGAEYGLQLLDRLGPSAVGRGDENRVGVTVRHESAVQHVLLTGPAAPGELPVGGLAAVVRVRDRRPVPGRLDP